MVRFLLSSGLFHTHPLYEGLGPEGSSNFMSAVALFDLIGGTKIYQDMVVGTLNTLMSINITTNLPT